MPVPLLKKESKLPKTEHSHGLLNGPETSGFQICQCGRVNWPARQLTRSREFNHSCSIVQRNHCAVVYLSFFFHSSIYHVVNFLFITYSLTFNPSRHNNNHSSRDAALMHPMQVFMLPRRSRHPNGSGCQFPS